MATIQQATSYPANLPHDDDISVPDQRLIRRRLLQAAAALGVRAAIGAALDPGLALAGREYALLRFEVLKSKPGGSSARAVLELDAHDIVRRIGGGTADYYKVEYLGKRGYLYAKNLVGGASSSPHQFTAMVSATDVGRKLLASRHAPDVDVIPEGTDVCAGYLRANGFINVCHGGRWSSAVESDLADKTEKWRPPSPGGPGADAPGPRSFRLLPRAPIPPRLRDLT